MRLSVATFRSMHLEHRNAPLGSIRLTSLQNSDRWTRLPHNHDHPTIEHEQNQNQQPQGLRQDAHTSPADISSRTFRMIL